MTAEQVEIMGKILYAVETGGQIYGRQDYSSFVEAYHSSPNEHAITIGAGQWYATSAKRLLQNIIQADPTTFRRIDSKGEIEKDLRSADWSSYKLSKTSEKARLIQAIIFSSAGIKCQDDLMRERVQSFEKEMIDLGVTDIQAICMGINLRHLGGLGAVKRVLRKTARPVTIDSIWAAMQSDSGNQVGGPLYRSRHQKVIGWIKEYIREEDEEKMANLISNSGGDERGKASGGKAGDQTGREWQIKNWYDRPWDMVLRHPDPKVRESIASNAEKAAANDNIGYNQGNRVSFYTQLKAAGWDPSKISKPCDSDCSAGVLGCVVAAGHQCGDKKLQAVNPNGYTGSMRAQLTAAGFQVLTDSKYLHSPDYLLRGDILLNEVHHTCTNLTNGAKSGAEEAAAPAKPQINPVCGTCKVQLHQFLVGAKHPEIRAIQRILNSLGYKGKDGKILDVDGELGDNTAYAITAFQKSKGMKDINFGTVAGTTWKYLLNA